MSGTSKNLSCFAGARFGGGNDIVLLFTEWKILRVIPGMQIIRERDRECVNQFARDEWMCTKLQLEYEHVLY